MEYGFQFANLEPARVRDLARVVEDEGYNLIVFPDHVVIEGAEGVYDPHTLAHDVVQLATVVATATTRIRVGHLVLCNPFRHPVNCRAEPRDAGPRQQWAIDCWNRGRMDGDRVSHDRHPVSAGRGTPRDAG